MQWWNDLMPPETEADAVISYQGKQRVVEVPGAVEVPMAQPEEPPLRGMGPLEIDTETEETDATGEENVAEHGHTETIVTHGPANPDLVMLIRPRKSRIYYLRKFFDYPITLTATTLGNLGPVRTV
jgi:hypothetical protein